MNKKYYTNANIKQYHILCQLYNKYDNIFTISRGYKIVINILYIWYALPADVIDFGSVKKF